MKRSFVRRDAHRILREFPQAVATDLSNKGYAVFDGIVSAATASQLCREIDVLSESGAMKPNSTHIVSANGKGRQKSVQFCKRNILEAELSQLSMTQRASVPNLVGLEADSTVTSLLSVYWPKLTLRSQAVKVQRNDAGGGCFPIHVDSSSTVDNRTVTALIYLNADWNPEHDGGSLRIYNYPTCFQDISPNAGRLVLLSSTGIHHRVLPSFRKRYMITLWCSGMVGTTNNSIAEETGDMSLSLRVAQALLSAKYRDMAFILTCSKEWEASIRQSHDDDVGDKLIQVHIDNVARIRNKLPKMISADIGSEEDEAIISDMITIPERLYAAFEQLEISRGQQYFEW